MSKPRRRVLVTGAAGQDGTYVARLCAARGDLVVGLSRRSSVDAAFSATHAVDINDEARLAGIVREVAPDECYHFAAYHRSSQTIDGRDADEERTYLQTNVTATMTLLALLREHAPRCRVLLAGSCHVFGDVDARPQSETTPMRPNSMYGITKAATLQLGRLYREKHGVYCCSAILFNHESPLRGDQFITKRLARAAADVARGQALPIAIGNPAAEVDWGFAGDYAEAMARMLGAAEPRDFVVASGAIRRVRDFAQAAFAHVGLDWQKYVRVDPTVHRPVSATTYEGDISRITAALGWRPRTSFEDLVHMMVDAELARAAA